MFYSVDGNTKVPGPLFAPSCFGRTLPKRACLLARPHFSRPRPTVSDSVVSVAASSLEADRESDFGTPNRCIVANTHGGVNSYSNNSNGCSSYNNVTANILPAATATATQHTRWTPPVSAIPAGLSLLEALPGRVIELQSLEGEEEDEGEARSRRWQQVTHGSHTAACGGGGSGGGGGGGELAAVSGHVVPRALVAAQHQVCVRVCVCERERGELGG